MGELTFRPPTEHDYLDVIAALDRWWDRGEAVDSWLEATAARMHTTVGALARLAGLSVAARPQWVRWIGPEVSNALAAATGVPEVAIQA